MKGRPDPYKRYPPGSPEALWYRRRFEEFGRVIAKRKADNPKPDSSMYVGYIGGDARYYLSGEESSDYAEAADQVQFQERELARERVVVKRAHRALVKALEI